MMGDIAAFVQLCKHPVAETYTDADDTYDCAYVELINLVLECTIAEETDCNSACLVHMRPFLQQCGAVMADMIAAVEPPDQSYQQMVGQCDAPTATAIVSPSGQTYVPVCELQCKCHLFRCFRLKMQKEWRIAAEK